MWPTLPIEFYVVGTPVSLQNATAKSRDEWRGKVRDAALAVIPLGSWALSDIRLSVSIAYFPAEVQGDVDNRIKLILDGLKPYIVLDDELVDRVVMQRIVPESGASFHDPTAVLVEAMANEQPTVYIRIDEAPLEGIWL
jgi:crossover junction endodeoxyribonuclease RusA